MCVQGAQEKQEMKTDDIIRDFTENDPDMRNLWVIGGKHYVLYRIVHAGKYMVTCARMASPSHPAGSGTVFKNFLRVAITRPSQTRGIYEVH